VSVATTVPSIQTNDEFDGIKSVRLDPGTVVALSRLSPARTVAALTREWGLLAVLIGGFTQLTQDHPLVWISYPLVATAIATRQHALAVLMHDATHWRLFKSKRLNDVVGETLTAWPLMVSMRTYRANHFAHHKFVNTLKDPDFARKQNAEWAFPMPKAKLLKILAMQLTGINTVYNIKATAGVPVPIPGWLKAARLAYYLLILGVLAYTGSLLGFVLLWVVPILSPLQLILRARSIAEHFGVGNVSDLDQTRTTLTSPLERVLLAPFSVGFHLEHHLFPSVPHFNLPALHERLMEVDTFKRQAHLTRGYGAVIDECAES
jgi:fatty acid desaturase